MPRTPREEIEELIHDEPLNGTDHARNAYLKAIALCLLDIRGAVMEGRKEVDRSDVQPVYRGAQRGGRISGPQIAKASGPTNSDK